MRRSDLDRLRTVLSREEGLILAYLFGSRATGKATSGSDWDVAVLFPRHTPALRRLFVESKLRQTTRLPVEVVDLQRIPVEFSARILKEGILLHALSKYAQVEYEATILSRAHDLGPLLAEQHREILEVRHHGRAVARYRAALGAPR